MISGVRDSFDIEMPLRRAARSIYRAKQDTLPALQSNGSIRRRV